MMVMIDGPMITRFAGDAIAFNKVSDDRFNILDTDCDGILSRNDLNGHFDWQLALDHDQQSNDEDEKGMEDMFDRFDVDKSGGIDRMEFRRMMMELMMAVVRGIGDTPVSVMVDEDSLVKKAYDHELTRIEHELLPKEVKMDGERDLRQMTGERLVHRNGKMNKNKKNSSILAWCACSGNFSGDD